MSAAAAAVSSGAVPDSSIQRLAVYGTLRDDDDSGAAWTKPFVGDVDSAETAVVSGFRLYASKKLGYPFAVSTGDAKGTRYRLVLSHDSE